MSKNKPKFYFWLEDNCLGYKVKRRHHGQQFGFDLTEQDGQRLLRNFLWSVPVPATLKELLMAIDNHRDLDRHGKLRSRLGLDKIKVKPDMEARYQSILRQLTVEP